MSAPEFDPCKAKALRDSGMKQAADVRRALLASLRREVIRNAAARPCRTATIDDATKALRKLRLPAGALGNAAGSLFKTREWEFTGEWRPSLRTSNHRRHVRVWRLKAST